jgi:hypothetical protein
LALGSHAITATVTDSQKLTITQTVHVQVVAKAPFATIFSPADGAIYAVDDTIAFRGDGTDLQDGSLPEAALVWTINGVTIGTGRLFTKQIPTLGKQSVALTVTNSAGLSAIATSTIELTAAQGKPTVVITSPPNNSFFRFGTDVITFVANAHTAAGGPIPDAAIQWSSDLDGFLGNGSTLKHTLSAGACTLFTHHVTVTVTANGKTASDTITVQVGQIC